MASSYDIWKTTDPNDGNDELFERLEEEYWTDVDTVEKDVIEFVSEVIRYHLMFPQSQSVLPEDSLFHHIMKEFQECCVAGIIERMVENIDYGS